MQKQIETKKEHHNDRNGIAKNQNGTENEIRISLQELKQF